MTADVGLEYKGVASISGPIIIVENVKEVGYDELVAVKTQTGETRLGKVIEVTQKAVTVQVFEGTTGLSPSETRTRFLGHPLEAPVSTEMLGRVMNSFGEPIDGHPDFGIWLPGHGERARLEPGEARRQIEALAARMRAA